MGEACLAHLFHIKKVRVMKKKKLLLQPKGSYWIWYILPALIIYVVFMAYPLLDSIRLSLFNNDGKFVGLQNFIRLFTDTSPNEAVNMTKRYWGALRNTFYFFMVHMLVQNVLGIVFATILTNPHMRGRKFYQTIIFAPTTFAIFVTGVLWKLLLSPIWTKNIFGALSQPWLGNESTALTFVSLVSCWQWVGIPTMMFVATLRNINEDIYEAASIEGANSWQIFWRIKLPLLKPMIGLVSILTFVNNFNAFDVVYAMQGANGPPSYSTDLLGTLFYRIGIAGQHPAILKDPAMGATIASITFVFLAVISMIVLSKTRTKE